MGTIMKFECVSCGFEKELFTGGGKMDCTIEAIMSTLHNDEQQTLSEVIKLGATHISIDRTPCVCTSCGEVYEVAVVRYTINNEEHTIFGICPSCKGKEHTKLSCCPDCKSELSISKTGLWD